MRRRAVWVISVLSACSAIVIGGLWYSGTLHDNSPRTSIAELRQGLAAVANEVTNCRIRYAGKGQFVQSGPEGIHLVNSLLDSLPSRGVRRLSYEVAGLAEISIQLCKTDAAGKDRVLFSFYVWPRGANWLGVSAPNFVAYDLLESELIRLQNVFDKEVATIRQDKTKDK